MSKIQKISSPVGNFSISEVSLHPKSGQFSKMKFWLNSLETVGFSPVKHWILGKEEGGEMGEIFFYLQETSLLEKSYFSLVPVPNCSRTNARNSLIYLYSVLLSGSYCTWHLL